MPRQVDQEERRRALAEAVFAVIGGRGWEAVSLRDVAAQAGVSMGSVQHWFRSKDEMLLFALQHMRARVLARMQARLATLDRPTPRQTIRAAFEVLLPVDEPGRQEAAVNLAFFSAATVNPAYAEQLREGMARLLDVSRARLTALGITDADAEATDLLLLTQGLVGPLLVGVLTPDEAFAVLDRRLDRLFGPSAAAPGAAADGQPALP